MFSDAISSISWRCRPSSPRIAAAISGSASASVAVKNESGADAVLAELAGGVIGEYLHRRRLFKSKRAGMCGGRKRRPPHLHIRGNRPNSFGLGGPFFDKIGGWH